MVERQNIMKNIKIIKTEEEHKEALEAIDALLEKDPDPESRDGELLSLMVTLVEEYEKAHFPQALPDPVDAILFRMEQQNLKPRDLVPYLGSASRVSEVLSRRRPLSINMIRALDEGLGIPAKVLIGEPRNTESVGDADITRFPWKEMARRGYFGKAKATADNAKTLLREFLAPFQSSQLSMAQLRKTNYARPTNKSALYAWSTKVLRDADEMNISRSFNPKAFDARLIRQLVQLSASDRGPLLAQKFLSEHGVALIIEPHFEQTYLDGAAFLINKEHPVIGMTLRHNRLDSFWFTLMHELGHVLLHYDKGTSFFDEDLESEDRASNEYEKQADSWASEILVPEEKWENSPAKLIPSPMAAESLARELGINVAIVAGTMRFRGQKYQYLTKLVHQNKVREFFPEHARKK